MKKNPSPIARFLALWLTFSLILPNPAFAMRVRNGGLEERTPTTDAIARDLQSGSGRPNPMTAGAEELVWPGRIPPERVLALARYTARLIEKTVQAKRALTLAILQAPVVVLERYPVRRAAAEQRGIFLNEADYFFGQLPYILGIAEAENGDFSSRAALAITLIEALVERWQAGKFPLQETRDYQVTTLLGELNLRNRAEVLGLASQKVSGLSDETQRRIASRLLDVLLAPASPTASGVEEKQKPRSFEEVSGLFLSTTLRKDARQEILDWDLAAAVRQLRAGGALYDGYVPLPDEKFLYTGWPSKGGSLRFSLARPTLGKEAPGVEFQYGPGGEVALLFDSPVSLSFAGISYKEVVLPARQRLVLRPKGKMQMEVEFKSPEEAEPKAILINHHFANLEIGRDPLNAGSMSSQPEADVYLKLRGLLGMVSRLHLVLTVSGSTLAIQSVGQNRTSVQTMDVQRFKDALTPPQDLAALAVPSGEKDIPVPPGGLQIKSWKFLRNFSVDVGDARWYLSADGNSVWVKSEKEHDLDQPGFQLFPGATLAVGHNPSEEDYPDPALRLSVKELPEGILTQFEFQFNQAKGLILRDRQMVYGETRGLTLRSAEVLQLQQQIKAASAGVEELLKEAIQQLQRPYGHWNAVQNLIKLIQPGSSIEVLESAIGPLIQMFSEGEEGEDTVRVAALRAFSLLLESDIQNYKLASAVRPISEQLQNGDQEVRHQAAVALSFFAGRGVEMGRISAQARLIFRALRNSEGRGDEVVESSRYLLLRNELRNRMPPVFFKWVLSGTAFNFPEDIDSKDPRHEVLMWLGLDLVRNGFLEGIPTGFSTLMRIDSVGDDVTWDTPWHPFGVPFLDELRDRIVTEVGFISSDADLKKAGKKTPIVSLKIESWGPPGSMSWEAPFWESMRRAYPVGSSFNVRIGHRSNIPMVLIQPVLPAPTASGAEEQRMPGEGYPAHSDSRVIDKVVSDYSGNLPPGFPLDRKPQGLINFFYLLSDEAQEFLGEFLSKGKWPLGTAVRKMTEFSMRFGKLEEGQANKLLSKAWVAAQGGGLSPGVMIWFSEREFLSSELGPQDSPNDLLDESRLSAVHEGAPDHTREELQRFYAQYRDLVRSTRVQPAYNSLVAALMEIQGYLEEEDWPGLFLAMRRARSEELAILTILLGSSPSYLESGALRNYVKLLHETANWQEDLSGQRHEMLRIERDLDDILDPAQHHPVTFNTRFSETFSSPGWSGQDRDALIRMVGLLQQGGPQMTPEQEAISRNLAAVGAHLMLRLEEALAEDAQANGSEDLTLLRSKVDFMKFRAEYSARKILQDNPNHSVWMPRWLSPYLAAGAEESTSLRLGQAEKQWLQLLRQQIQTEKMLDPFDPVQALGLLEALQGEGEKNPGGFYISGIHFVGTPPDEVVARTGLRIEIPWGKWDQEQAMFLLGAQARRKSSLSPEEGLIDEFILNDLKPTTFVVNQNDPIDGLPLILLDLKVSPDVRSPEGEEAGFGVLRLWVEYDSLDKVATRLPILMALTASILTPEALQGNAAGAEEGKLGGTAVHPDVRLFQGFTEGAGLPLEPELRELVRNGHVREGKPRAVVISSSDSAKLGRLFIEETLPQVQIDGVQTIKLPADLQKAAEFLQRMRLPDATDLIVLPLAVPEGSEKEYRPIGSNAPILVTAGDVLEEAAARGNLDELAQIAANLRNHDQVLRVDADRWAERVSDQQDAFSISY